MEFRKRLYQIQKIEITQNLKDKIESLRMDKFKKIQGGGAEEEDGLVDIDWKNIDFYKENSTQFGDFSTKFLFDKLRETYYLYLRKENRSRSAKKKGDTGTYMSWSAVELKETIEILQEILSETDEGEVGCVRSNRSENPKWDTTLIAILKNSGLMKSSLKHSEESA
jgi:predicted Zn-dependent peptidase